MYKRNFFTLQLKYDQITIQIDSLVKLPYTGKINRFRNNILTEFAQYRILIIQNAEILRFLIFDDQFLDADIFLHCMMTIQMILCDVKDRTDLWCKLLNRLKLKAADLCHCCRIFFHFQCFGCIRCSDISYHKNRFLCITHDLAKQCCRSSLSVCSGDRQHTALSCTISKLHFSPYRKSHIIKLLYDRNICRYSGTEYYQIKACFYFFREFSRIDLSLLSMCKFTQNCILICIFISVKENHMSPCLFQKIRGSDTTFACSKDKYSFSL